MIPAAIPRDAFPITPNDTNGLSETAYGLYCETGGTVRYLTQGGTEFTDTVPDGGYIIMAVKKVFAFGTSAEGIRGYRLH